MVPLIISLIVVFVTPMWEKYQEEKIDRFKFQEFLETENVKDFNNYKTRLQPVLIFQSLDLEGKNLSGIDLSQVSLFDVNLKDADLSDSTLRETVIVGDISDANLSNSIISDSDLRRIYSNGTNFDMSCFQIMI